MSSVLQSIERVANRLPHPSLEPDVYQTFKDFL